MGGSVVEPLDVAFPACSIALKSGLASFEAVSGSFGRDTTGAYEVKSARTIW